MVASLNPERILATKLSLSKEMFICLKASSCNRLAALPRSTSILCTSKLLIHKVSTSASWCGVMTLDELIRGKDIGPSIGWISLLLFGCGWYLPGLGLWLLAAASSLALRLVLVVDLATQYVIYGQPGFKRELCAGRYFSTAGGGLSSANHLPNISLKVADLD